MRALAGTLLLLDLLDLASSARASHIDALRPAPEKPLWAWIAQSLLAVAGLVWAARYAPRAWRALRDAPIPRPAALAAAAFALVAAGHVAFRAEHYPFSNVGMFSTAVPDGLPRAPARVTDALLVVEPEGVEAMSFLREGSPLFARHGFGWDYKAGWAMHMYALGHSRALDIVRARLLADGLPAPARLRVRVSRKDGRLLTRDEKP